MAMRTRRLCVTLGFLLGTAAPAAAQGRGRGRGPKKYVVTNDRALVVTREVLVRHGYEVVRVEDGGPDVVVWYRRGNRGRDDTTPRRRAPRLRLAPPRSRASPALPW